MYNFLKSVFLLWNVNSNACWRSCPPSAVYFNVETRSTRGRPSYTVHRVLRSWQRLTRRRVGACFLKQADQRQTGHASGRGRPIFNKVRRTGIEYKDKKRTFVIRKRLFPRDDNCFQAYVNENRTIPGIMLKQCTLTAGKRWNPL